MSENNEKKEGMICFNKVLFYVVVLLLAVLGGMYFVNSANQAKVTNQSQAGYSCAQLGGICRTDPVCTNVPGPRTYTQGPSDTCGVGSSLTCCLPSAYTPPGATCTGLGGNWYNATSYPTCSNVGANYAAVTGNTDTKTGSNCCIAGRMPTLTPFPIGTNTCSGFGGNWYNATSYPTCSNVGANYAAPGGTIADLKTGYNCCIAGRMPTLTAGSTTCLGFGGDWYRTSSYPTCTDVGSNYSAVSPPAGAVITDNKAGSNCCIAGRMPALPAGSATCRGFGGNWYNAASFAACSNVAANYTPVTLPAGAVITDATTWTGYNCCIAGRMPTPTPGCMSYPDQNCWPSGTTCTSITAAGRSWNTGTGGCSTAGNVCCKAL